MTDLQKPFTNKQLLDAAKRPSWCKTCEPYNMCPTLAKAVLVERGANAARVLELEAENKRLREGLTHIDALAPLRELMNMMHPSAISGLVLRMGEIARTTLKGGEI
jgi:hypothetical protein